MPQPGSGRPRSRGQELVQRRLLLRVTLPGLIGLVLLAFATIDLLRGHVPVEVMLWLVPGVVLGYPFGRLTRVAWDSEAAQLVQGGGGLLLMAAYLVVRLGARVLLTPSYVDIPFVSNAAALVGAGLLLGRSLGLARLIRTELRGRQSNQNVA